MYRIIFFFLLNSNFNLYSQEYNLKVKYTDSCIVKLKIINEQLNKVYNYLEVYYDSANLYRDSLGKKYRDIRYKDLFENYNSDIWLMKISYYDSMQRVFDKTKSRKYSLLKDSLNDLQYPRYANLEVLYKEDPKDLDAYMDFYNKNNGVDLTFNHPRLKGSKIANLKIGDSMSFYFFTWYTIEGNWKYIKNRKDLTKNNRIGIVDGVINGDLPVELYRYYDSMGYTKVWFLRKMTLTRLPCYWLVTAYKDIYFNNDNFKFYSSQYDSMMKDGKERFKFEYEATLANCYTSMKGKIEYTFPIDFYKENYLMSNESFYLHDVIWRYAEYELLYKPQKNFRDFHRYKTYRRNYRHNYMSNNFMVKFSDGTYTTRYIPFWLYLRKKYVRHWTPNKIK